MSLWLWGTCPAVFHPRVCHTPVSATPPCLPHPQITSPTTSSASLYSCLILTKCRGPGTLKGRNAQRPSNGLWPPVRTRARGSVGRKAVSTHSTSHHQTPPWPRDGGVRAHISAGPPRSPLAKACLAGWPLRVGCSLHSKREVFPLGPGLRGTASGRTTVNKH